MILYIIIPLFFIAYNPVAEHERIGAEVSLSYAGIKDFPPSIGGGIDIIFITGEKLGGSLGFEILKNKGESFYKKNLPGTELESALSSRYITITGFELDYILVQKKLSPFTGFGIHWLYFHEQSKYVYTSPGWIITEWRNYEGNGYCIKPTLGVRYISSPSFAAEGRMEVLLGSFFYPPLNRRIEIKGININLGIRL